MYVCMYWTITLIGALAIKHVMNFTKSTVFAKICDWEDIGVIFPKYS